MGVFEVTQGDIQRLNALQLTELLKKLLHLESKKFGIIDKTIDVSLKINSSDGGEDGRITWRDPIEETDFIPHRDTLFQCKQRNQSSDFAKTRCEKELIEKVNGNFSIKPIINDLFTNGGHYILFCNFSCNKKKKQDRIEGFRNGLRKAGVGYAATVAIQVYDSEKIADWVNQYLPAIVFVYEKNGKYIPSAAQSWNEWDSHYPNTFFKSEIIGHQIDQLRAHLSGKRRVVRIIGNSGLGKTRLACEVFRPPTSPTGDIVQYELSSNVVYIDARDCTDIVGTLSHWRQNHLSGIVVVDECDCELHNRLLSEIQRRDSNLSLLTIDYTEGCGDKENLTIELGPAPDFIIQNIIQEAYPHLPGNDIERIVEIVKGYPKMAVMIAENRKAGLENAAEITNEEFIDRLIWGRDQPNEEQKTVLSACSLFTAFGFKEDVQDQRQFIAEVVCGINPDVFYQKVTEIKRSRRIIEERNRYWRVVPPPLAITLATRWWRSCSPEKARRILLGDIPEGLVSPLCDQFRFIHLEIGIQELTADLCGPQGPFGQAEILNSYRGSRIFRSITEVNPNASVEALDRCFGDWSTEDLKKVGEGRRNLIWALENLMFWEETFQKAARLMLSFAVAETENGIGNNATGQFYQIFHYLLSGTKASLMKRLEIIDEGLATGKSDYQRICIEALGHALQTHGFNRISGVEKQGSRFPQEDWRPKKWKEVFDYWEAALERLTEYAVKEGDISIHAKSVIEKSIPGLLRFGRLDVLERTIFKIQERYGKFWPEVLYELKWFLLHYSEKIPKEGKRRIENWIESLGPRSFREKFYIIVTRPEHWFTHESANWIKEAQERVDRFASETCEYPDELFNNIDVLYRGNLVNGYEFGLALGKCLGQPERFIDESLENLKKLKNIDRSIAVLSGFLYSLRSESANLVSNCLEIVAGDADLLLFLIPLSAQIQPKKEDLDRLIRQFKKGLIDVDQFRILEYGGALSHLPPDVVIPFLDSISEISQESTSLLIGIMNGYTLNDKEKYKASIPFIRKLILQKGHIFTITRNLISNYETYEISKYIIAILREGNPDIELAQKILEDIIELCDKYPVASVDLAFKFPQLLEELFSDNYVKSSWKILSEAIIIKNRIQWYGISELIGKKDNFSEGLIHKVPISDLDTWCLLNKDIAPLFLAKTMTPIIKHESEIQWSGIANYLFKNFGKNSKLLKEIDVNLENYSYVGSGLPYLESVYKAFNQILNHQNPSVKRWAIRKVRIYKEKIEKSKKYAEEEKDLGIISPSSF